MCLNQPNLLYEKLINSRFLLTLLVQPPCFDGGFNPVGFDPNLKTIVIVPGFLNKDTEEWMEEAKSLWLKIEQVNVVLVNWPSGSGHPYWRAAANTPIVARQIAIFLRYLVDQFALPLRNVHIIGHSLGAHIGGFVGKDLAGIGRITGLDPAGPSFDKMNRFERLDKTDAKLVDIIHTNAGKIHYSRTVPSYVTKTAGKIVSKIPFIGKPLEDKLKNTNYTNEGDTAWFGIEDDIGHIDYYANNGKVQPGCDDFVHECEHGRAIEIFIDILKHELMMKESNLGRKKLLAFKADDYDNFLTGRSFVLSCPSLFNTTKQLLSPDKEIQSCSVPLDLITPVDEFIGTYGQRFNYNDNHSKSSQRYFFKTLRSRQLLGDHYLLKVNIDPRDYAWHPDCSLNVELYSPKGEIDHIELNKDSVKPWTIEADKATSIMVPFINRNSQAAREDSSNYLFDPIKSQLDDILLPLRVEIKIDSAKTTTVGQATWVKMKELAQLNNKPENLFRCRIAIKSLEILPIISEGRGFVGTYCVSDRCWSFIRNLRHLGNQNQQHNPSDRGSTVIYGDGNPSNALYRLDTILVP